MDVSIRIRLLAFTCGGEGVANLAGLKIPFTICDIAGSSPAPRIIFVSVTEWLGTGLQSQVGGFDSHSGLF